MADVELSKEAKRTHISTSAPLSCLPLSSVLRSYLITTISSSPLLLRPSLSILSFLARSKAPFLNPDANPVLKYVLKKTFYAQFCAGETPAEVKESVVKLKALGFKGVILGYGREVVMDQTEAGALGGESPECERIEEERCKEEVEEWKKGTLETVRLADDGDFVALKFTGAGKEALRLLANKQEPSERLKQAIKEICELAGVRKVRLLFDAEQAVVQDGIDGWTLECMRRYNRGGKALVYGTYQAYRKSTPATLARHLEVARRESFTLGVKLVRGAYLGSDPRPLFWGTKEETDRKYDGIAESLITRRYRGVLKVIEGEEGNFPDVDLVLASHNRNTVTKARMLRNRQLEVGDERIRLVYGQLMGMADEISCELVQAGKEVRGVTEAESVDVPKAYKYLVWGTVGECTKYLLRRAQENRDAVSRTRDGRIAMGKELRRRVTRVLTFGLLDN
jgi:proline dehydrogenase